ncbi:hypothetical protein RHGRI_025857 [Rhododendron griersonianum]|uniref:Uncharacterized protein n=1 Tax=Rhododendron griersonianum TaxID=479676 RepID=A0AAV6IT18_9ERIC|nr:hypothetical protein RHGRI_025857 [Rhododendron griersonianum]
MAPKKKASLAEKGKGVCSSGHAANPDFVQDPAPAEGLAWPRRRNREQIQRDEQLAWEASYKGRRVKAERFIIRDSFPPDNEVIQSVVRQGLLFWFERNPGFNIELVEEFYKHMVVPEAGTELHPEARITSRIGRIPVIVTPGIIAARMLYTPPTGETNYPVLNEAFDRDIIFENMIVEFRDVSTNTRLPFPVLISTICRAEEGLASKYFKNDEPHPGDIDSSILQKSAAHSKGRRGALLTEPPANANTNTWLRKIFCLEAAVAKSQQKLKKEVRQIGREQQVLAH